MENLRKLRKAKRLSQEELARMTGLTQGYIAMLESGKRDNPTKAVLDNLAAALGVTISELTEKSA